MAEPKHPDVIKRLAARVNVEPDQGPPLPEDVKQRERARVERDHPVFEDQGPPADAAPDANLAMVYRGYRAAGSPQSPGPYVPPEGTHPTTDRHAKLAVLAERGELTPDLIRQLPAEDQEWMRQKVAEKQKLHQREQVLSTLRRYWYGLDPIEKLAASIKDEGEELPADVVPAVDVDPANARALLPGGRR